MDQPAPYVDVHTHDMGSAMGEQVMLYSHQVQDVLPAESGIKQPFTGGLHPWHADKFSADELTTLLEKYRKHEGFVGVGEVGLDRVKGPQLLLQQQVLTRQLEWAQQFCLPVVIHNVKADADLMAMRKKFSLTPWIIHGFQGNFQQAEHWLRKGCYLSIGAKGVRSYMEAPDVIRSIPAEKLFLETDDQQSVGIDQLYRQVADLRGITVSELRVELYKNFRRIFTNDK